MKPHKYFRQKKAQQRRIQEYKKIFYYTDSAFMNKELTDRQKGRMKKVNYCDCGRSKCNICSDELYPVGKKLRTESKKIIKTEINDV